MTKWQLAIGMSTCLDRCTACGVEIGRGPCNDKRAVRPLLAKALAQVRQQQLVANAGYGAECVHEFCRERWRVNSWIPWQRLVEMVKCNPIVGGRGQ
jgi:Tfp pilus assembly pilus retraction ATPase PilT